MLKLALKKEAKMLLQLMLVDLAAVFLAFAVAYWFRISSEIISYNTQASFANYFNLYCISIPLLLVVFRMAHLYDFNEILAGTTEYVQVIKGISFYLLAVIFAGFAVHSSTPSRGWLLCLWLVGILFTCAGRFGFRRFVKRYWNGNRPVERVIIIGVSEESRAIAERLEKTQMVNVVGFLDDFSPTGETIWEDKTVLGAPKNYQQIAARVQADMAVLVPDAISWETRKEILSQTLCAGDIQVQVAPGFSDMHLFAMRVGFKGDVPLLRFRPGYTAGLDGILKAIIDYGLGTFLLIVFSPVMLILALALGLSCGTWPIKGYQVLGVNGTRFRTLKFRTKMEVPTKYRSFLRRVELGAQSPTMSRLERFLFHTGFDKLPQLINVLRGEMSIVGPRTIPPQMARSYGEWLANILVVKPGITGTWAIREARDLNQEIAFSLLYVRNWNLWSDTAILAQTAFEMLRTRFRTRIRGSQDHRVRGSEGERMRG